MMIIIITLASASFMVVMYAQEVSWAWYIPAVLTYAISLSISELILNETHYKIKQLEIDLEKENKINASYNRAFKVMQEQNSIA